MTEAIRELLGELEAFGLRNDREHGDRSRRMLNLSPDAGEFLAVAVRASKARDVLEIGTSNGYSTLWLVLGLGSGGGNIVTVDFSEYKVAMAAENFARAGVGGVISQKQADAGVFLAECADASFDFIFLDSERTEYVRWWPDVRRALRPGGTIVADNALSHPEELAEFRKVVDADPAFLSCLVPVGKGEYFASRIGE
ncbi:MAG: class I SAM-dependent methyltransferase [Candidatus Eisenbacteria bacterium]